MKITITLPDEMNKLIEEYCEEFGATKSGYIQKCIKAGFGLTTKHEKFPENFITPREKLVTQNIDFNKVGEIVKKVKKSETCPHMISIGGICNPCGGIAK